MKPRHTSAFLCATLVLAAPLTGQGAVKESMVVEATIDQLQGWMKSGQLTSRRLIEIYLSRIDRYDRHGPRLNSLLEVNLQALPSGMANSRSMMRDRCQREMTLSFMPAARVSIVSRQRPVGSETRGAWCKRRSLRRPAQPISSCWATTPTA